MTKADLVEIVYEKSVVSPRRNRRTSWRRSSKR